MFGLFGKETFEQELLPRAREVLEHMVPVMPRFCIACWKSGRGVILNYGQMPCPACNGREGGVIWFLELLTCSSCYAQAWPDRKANPHATEYLQVDSAHYHCPGCKAVTYVLHPLDVRPYDKECQANWGKTPLGSWRMQKAACERFLANSPPLLAEWMRMTRIPPGLWNVPDPPAEYDQWLKAPKIRQCKRDRTFYPEHLPACPTCRQHYDQTLMRDPTSCAAPVSRRPGPERRCPTCSTPCADDERVACYYCLTTLSQPGNHSRAPIPPLPSKKPKPAPAEIVSWLEGHHRDVFFHLFPEYKKFAAAK